MVKIGEMKPCPFCGEPAILCEDEESENSQYFVRCSSFMCGCRIESHQLPYGASNYWNHRPTESALRKRVEELEEANEDAYMAGYEAGKKTALTTPAEEEK